MSVHFLSNAKPSATGLSSATATLSKVKILLLFLAWAAALSNFQKTILRFRKGRLMLLYAFVSSDNQTTNMQIHCSASASDFGHVLFENLADFQLRAKSAAKDITFISIVWLFWKK